VLVELVKSSKFTPYFYKDSNGNKVMTAAYHLKRGYCCGNNCKHCPFKSDLKFGIKKEGLK
jgi:biotin synthase-like enzyme